MKDDQEFLQGEMRAHISKVIGILRRLENAEVITTVDISKRLNRILSSRQIHFILLRMEKKRKLKHLGVYDPVHREFARI